MELRIVAAGDIVERQELLNGTRSIAIEGASDDGAWSVSGAISWNRGLLEYAGEGDLTLSHEDGDEILATLTRATVNAQGDDGEPGVDHVMKLEYAIDGGAGAFEGAGGRVTGTGALSGERFEATWTVAVETAG